MDPPLIASVTAPEHPEPPRSLIPPAICPIFLGLRRSLPVVLCWMRMRKGLSQGQLATMIGSRRQNLSQAENGSRMPSLEKLTQIAEALGTDVRRVFLACEYLMSDNS